MTTAPTPSPWHPPRHPPKRLHLQAWLWGAIELAALFRARWLQRGSRTGA
ncbi:hypothetical protein [Piscinibacter gummiphilus]|nr:hypothetical protein [Piscinibacter gummiphilus]GLS96313.1 hypothetical protein GCM10007918_36050 [Piscinibacter gummiphilus]